MDDAEVIKKISSEDVEKVRITVKETQDWLEQNTSATTEELEAKYGDCETHLKPVSLSIYAADARASPAGMAAAAEAAAKSTGKAAEPVEEVD